MNRRDFLKSSSVAIATATVYLPDVFTEKLPEKYVDPAQWFRENREWLKKWFKKSEMKPYPDWIVDGHPMQIFKDEADTDIRQRNNIIFTESLKPSIMKELDFIHMDSILLACIFGVESLSRLDRTMSGFVEQVGRYPTKKDRILVQYISLFRKYKYHRLRLLWDGGQSEYETYVLSSELRIKVLQLPPRI